jgi:hypothetical protein
VKKPDTTMRNSRQSRHTGNKSLYRPRTRRHP